MKWGLMINPTSGGGRGRRVGEETKSILQKRKIAFTDISGSSYESARSALREAKNQISGLIVVGGDGIVHLAIQEIAQSPLPLVVIPAGTGNDFARMMNLPLDDPGSILDRCFENQPVAIDLGKAGDEFFADILSTGFDSVVNERANRMRFIKGQMKYTVAILLELPLFKPIHYHFQVDSQEFRTPAMLIAIANGSSYGGGMQVCPGADIEDGLFDLMILAPVSKIEFLKVFPKVFSGTHITHPAVSMMRGKKISVTAEAIAYADGERIGPLPISAEVVPAALRTWKF